VSLLQKVNALKLNIANAIRSPIISKLPLINLFQYRSQIVAKQSPNTLCSRTFNQPFEVPQYSAGVIPHLPSSGTILPE